MEQWLAGPIEFLLARPPLSHAVLALSIMGAASVMLGLSRVVNGHWVAAALAIGFYWGREKRDHEASLRLPTEEVWQQGWIPLEWSARADRTRVGSQSHPLW